MKKYIMEKSTFEKTAIWNRAYEIFTDPNRSESQQYNHMQQYLESEVKAGNITVLEKCLISHDTMVTSGYCDDLEWE